MWLLDAFRRQGHRAILIECHSLGSGQTGIAQGILHSGIKYLFQQGSSNDLGEFEGATDTWRRALLGQCEPNLSSVAFRSQHCYLWRTDSVRSMLGMAAAVHGLKTRPEPISLLERPAALRRCPGQVWRLDEQVIDPASLLAVLAERNRGHVWWTSSSVAPRFQWGSQGELQSVTAVDRYQQREVEVTAQHFIFAAGAGNAALRASAGLDPSIMQLRPLHVAMLVGRLPDLNGHCVDGASTRVTITSQRCPDARVAWQLGGRLSETGVKDSSEKLIERAQHELHAVLPGVNFDNCRWITRRIDRAEAKTTLGTMPSGPQVRCERNVLTVWPTKLVLAPKLADMVARHLGPATSPDAQFTAAVQDMNWPAPALAPPLWKEAETWQRAA